MANRSQQDLDTFLSNWTRGKKGTKAGMRHVWPPDWVGFPPHTSLLWAVEFHSHRALHRERKETSEDEERERGEECGTFMTASRIDKTPAATCQLVASDVCGSAVSVNIDS